MICGYYDPLKHLQDLQSLELESLGILEPVSDNHQPLELPNLLFLTMISDPSHLYLLATPQLQTLRNRFLTVDVGFADRTVDYYGEQWPKLLHLDLLLNRIYHIRFHGGFMLYKLTLRTHTTVAGVCHQMALHPELFPVLQELELMSAPEWDILCIMLEKRLVARTKGVRGLNRVYLGYAPPDIRYFVSMILKGHIVERRSNYELSLLRISRDLLDKTM